MTSLIGKAFIDFTAQAVMSNNIINNNFSLKKEIEGKIAVLFFYPLDFTFVCPTEIIELSNNKSEFSSRNAEVFTISIDSHYSHLAYRNLPIDQGGIGQVNLTMISDITKEISRNYNVLHDNAIALRAVFIIDEHGIIKHQTVNDLSIGRNIPEILRTIDAISHYEKYGENCPVNWKKGQPAISVK